MVNPIIADEVHAIVHQLRIAQQSRCGSQDYHTGYDDALSHITRQLLTQVNVGDASAPIADQTVGSGDVVDQEDASLPAGKPPMMSFLDRLKALSPLERYQMGRLVRGEADSDLIRRGDIMHLLRDLRTNPVKSYDYQRALSDVGKHLGKIMGIPTTGTPEISQPLDELTIRNNAFDEVVAMMKLSPHLVHPVFVPAVEGLKYTPRTDEVG